MRYASLLFLPLFALGCGDESAEIKAELDERLVASTTIYHGGCDQLAACSQQGRVCTDVGDALRAQLGADTPVVLEWEAPEAVIGVRSYYYFVEPDGSGAFYSDHRSDVDGSDCGDYCGWHRKTFGARQLFDGEALHLAPSGTAIQDFGLCGWP